MERLQRVLAARGIASRRRAEELIRAGRVTVDGRVVAELGAKVDPRAAAIAVDGKPLRAQRPRYVLLNKPAGYITTTNDERGRQTVMDLVPSKERIYPVGRLDRDTEGLLLLTNDGEVAHRVMHPRHELAKEYHVVTLVRPSDATARRVRDGVLVEGRRIVPDEFRLLRETREGIVLKLVIHEGMYHAVRRMMDAVGIPVAALRRVRLGPLTVAGIPPGGWRDLSDGERASLFEALRLRRDDLPEIDRPAQIPRGGAPRRRGRSSSPTTTAAVPPPATGRGGGRRRQGRGDDGDVQRERPAAESVRSDEGAATQSRPHRRAADRRAGDPRRRGTKGERPGHAGPPRSGERRSRRDGPPRDGSRPGRRDSKTGPPGTEKGAEGADRRGRSAGRRRGDERADAVDASRREPGGDGPRKANGRRRGRPPAQGANDHQPPRTKRRPVDERAARDGQDDR